MVEKKLLTRKETAKFFDVTVRTITNWTSQGIITPTKVGGKVFFLKSDLEALFNPSNTSSEKDNK